MPIHDWSRVPVGLFHHFHRQWTAAICDALNWGILPKGHYALLEANDDADRFEAAARLESRFGNDAGEEERYAMRADRVAIHNPLGEVVAVVEIVSPGNKSSRRTMRAFVEKNLNFLQQGIHLLIIDLFPPGPRDPQGIHKVLWDEIHVDPFELPRDGRLTLGAYSAGLLKTAYVEPVAVGDALPDMPVFLDSETYVLVSLEAAYLSTWNQCPEEFREFVSAPED